VRAHNPKLQQVANRKHLKPLPSRYAHVAVVSFWRFVHRSNHAHIPHAQTVSTDLSEESVA